MSTDIEKKCFENDVINERFFMIKELKIKSGHELRYAPFKVDTYKVKL